MENLTGAELLVRSLKAAGVEGAFMKEHPELEAMEEAFATEGSIKLISPVSETSCVPMADGYTRFSGRPAAAISASGGHALNQVAGVASAWADKSPVISISVGPEHGESASPIYDRVNWRQEGAFEAVTRWTSVIDRWEKIPHIIRRGVLEAGSARGGPVHIEIPESLLKQRRELDSTGAAMLRAAWKPAQAESPPMGDSSKVREAVELLNKSERPLILAGGGVIRSGAVDEINELARKYNAPITATMGGMGAALPDNPCFMGPSSYLSGEAFHTAIKRADVVLAVGCCFSGLDGFGLPPLWSAKIKFIQVNIDPENIALNPPAAVAVVGDAGQVLRAMLDSAPSNAAKSPEWLEKLKSLNRQHHDRIMEEASRNWELIHPAQVPTTMYEVGAHEDPILVLDGGNTALWAGMMIPVPGPRRGFFPMGMGTLGLGIPVSIGVKAAAGSRRVAILSGDGAYLYNVHELETMRRYDMPIASVIINDSAWNMIRAGQAMAGEVFGTDLASQDYAAVARSYGLFGKRVTRLEELKPALEEAFNSGKASVVDVVTDPDTVPDSLVSFARVEFEGAKMPPMKLMKGLRSSSMKLDVRAWNLMKFIAKSR